jgi:diguanylate cyclase (GGDEF)-like protein/PAS domain S-box-containing protein
MSDTSDVALCEHIIPTKRKYFDTNTFILFSGIFISLILIGSCTFSLLSLHNEALVDTQNNLKRLSLALAEQTALAFHEIDVVIKEARTSLGAADMTDQNRQALHQELHQLYHGLLQGQALLVFDAKGQMYVHSRVYPTPDIRVADRKYFLAHVDNAEDNLFISAPLRNRVNKNWMISVSRRLYTPDGGFGGVIMAAIDMNYFNRLYRALNLPSEATIELLRSDGTLLAASPFKPSRLGSRQSVNADDSEALHSRSQIAGFPLQISLSLPRQVALRHWYHLVWLLCPGVLAVLAGIGLLTATVLFLVNKDRRRACIQKHHLEEQVAKRTADLNDLLEFNKTVISTSPIGIAAYTHDGECVSVNDVFSRIVGIEQKQLEAQNLESLPALRTSGLLGHARQTLATGLTARHEGVCNTASGRPIWIDYQVVRFSRNKIKHLLLLVSDITERKRMEEELRLLAFTDSLTGVNNRRRFLDLARNELSRVARNARPYCFLILDIDHFKDVNDTYGHEYGDHVLKKLAAVCLRELRGTDIFGRIGGEEFAAVLIETAPAKAMEVAERLRESVANEPVERNGQSIPITISIGIGFRRDADDTFHAIMRRADKALYAAKTQGRNRVVPEGEDRS